MSLASSERFAGASETAVVILNYNGEQLLRQFLPIVIQHSGRARVVVADNASTDRSREFVTTSFAKVEWIQLDQNYGFCGGYNRALRLVTADYYILLNSDVEVTPNWLDALVTRLQNDQSVAAVQPKILSYINKKKFEHAGAGGGFIDSLGYPFCRGRIFDHVEDDHAPGRDLASRHRRRGDGSPPHPRRNSWQIGLRPAGSDRRPFVLGDWLFLGWLLLLGITGFVLEAGRARPRVFRVTPPAAVLTATGVLYLLTLGREHASRWAAYEAALAAAGLTRG